MSEDLKQSYNNPETNKLDRDRIRKLSEFAAIKGACFGRDLSLSHTDREQISCIVDLAQIPIDRGIDACGDDWKIYESLLDEGEQKGALLSLTYHHGTRVPTFIVKGGADSTVHKVLQDGQHPGISVPPDVFALIHWQKSLESLRQYGTEGLSDETIRGRSTHSFGEDLRQIRYYLATVGVLEARKQDEE